MFALNPKNLSQNEQFHMLDFIKQITEGSSILIEGKAHLVTAKALYAMQSQPENTYFKIFFTDESVLVLSPTDQAAYYGIDLGNSGIKPNSPHFSYENKEYTLNAADYQIVLRLFFGSPITTEGEVAFWDYISSDDNDLISLAIISRTGKRSDVFAKTIEWNILKLETPQHTTF